MGKRYKTRTELLICSWRHASIWRKKRSSDIYDCYIWATFDQCYACPNDDPKLPIALLLLYPISTTRHHCFLVLNSLGHPLLTILSSGGFSDSSSMLALLRIRIMSEDLLRKVEDGKWARNTSRCTNSDDCLPQKSALSHPPHLQETHQVPARNHSHETKSTSNLEVVDDVCQPFRSRVISQLIVSSSEEAEDKDEGEEHYDEWDVDPQRSAQEYKGDERHHNIVVPLACIVALGQCSGYIAHSIGCNNAVDWVIQITNVHPVATKDHEYGKWERVSKDEFRDAGHVHSDASKEVERSADGG